MSCCIIEALRASAMRSSSSDSDSRRFSYRTTISSDLDVVAAELTSPADLTDALICGSEGPVRVVVRFGCFGGRCLVFLVGAWGLGGLWSPALPTPRQRGLP
jgi:hypothetical protein